MPILPYAPRKTFRPVPMCSSAAEMARRSRSMLQISFMSTPARPDRSWLERLRWRSPNFTDDDKSVDGSGVLDRAASVPIFSSMHGPGRNHSTRWRTRRNIGGRTRSSVQNRRLPTGHSPVPGMRTYPTAIAGFADRDGVLPTPRMFGVPFLVI